MTRSDVMASSRPNGAAATERGGQVARARRALLLVPVLVALALALVAPGVAAAAGESTSGYGQKPEEPKTTTTSPNEPKTGTSPSKEEKSNTPETATEPGKTSSTSSSGTSPAKAGTLPFTGLDLRFTVVIGLLLVAGGLAIVVTQRRARSGS